jgi:hypothetical protein
VDLLKTEPDSCMEKCVTSSHAEKRVISIQVECITDVEEEGDLKPAAFVGVKTEHEVRIVYVSLLSTGHRHQGLHNVFHLHLFFKSVLSTQNGCI